MLKRTVPGESCDKDHDRVGICRLSTKVRDKVRPFRLRGSEPFNGKVELVIALLCPGQGSQTPGMLNDWLELAGAREILESLSEAAKVDLISLGTTASEEEIKDTAVAQPLIVATSILTVAALETDLGEVSSWAGVVAGHSVGEFAATAIAGILSREDATRLVGIRGRAMARAAAENSTGMAAVIGPDPVAAEEAIINAGLVPANVNGGGQIVAAGAKDALDEFAAAPPEKTRVIPLAVAGAFHTQYMASAVVDVQQAADALTANEPQIPILTNATGKVVESGAQMLSSLVSQITSPVRWDLCQENLAQMNTAAIVELAPGGVLTGLARRTLRGVPAVAVKGPGDLDAARELISEHLPSGSKDAS